MLGDDFVSGKSGAGHHDDEPDMRISGGDDRRDQSAFGVTHEPDTLGIDFLAMGEKFGGGLCVIGKVKSGGFPEFSGRLTDSSVVVAKDRDASPG